MFELSRTVRLCIPLRGNELSPEASCSPPDRLTAYYEFEVHCRGEADSVTGYVLNISTVDELVRAHGLPILREVFHNRPDATPPAVLREIVCGLEVPFNGLLHSIVWRLTPFHRLTLRMETMNQFILAQEFSFAAAHRLHCSSMTDAENRAVFGKCNNPSGHGHNYRLEVAVAVPFAEGQGDPAFSAAELDRIVHERVLLHLDHKNLNLDVPEFRNINPSVEHIARLCHDRLVAPLAQAGAGVRLEHVTVWETDKTSCTYPA